MDSDPRWDVGGSETLVFPSFQSLTERFSLPLQGGNYVEGGASAAGEHRAGDEGAGATFQQGVQGSARCQRDSQPEVSHPPLHS